MKNLILAAAALLASMALLTGCSSTVGVEATGKTGWDADGVRTLEKNVVFASSGLKGDLEIVDLRSAMANDMMRVQATLRSRDRDTLTFEYRFEWYDANGIELGMGTSAWKPLLLYGKETKNIQASAPDPRAREFKLKLRAPEK